VPSVPLSAALAIAAILAVLAAAKLVRGSLYR
jgi:hypothetical protein